MRPQLNLLALWTSIVPHCLGIIISPLIGAGIMKNELFDNSKDIYAQSWGSSSHPSAIRSFTDGPFGIGKGIILSTGSLTSPLAPGDTCPSSYTTDQYDLYTQNSLCGPNTYNGASLLVNFLPTKATTLLIDMVIASCDTRSGDKVVILVNGVNYAKDENNVPLDSSSKYLSETWGIPTPNGDTAFETSSPPLRFSIPLPKSNVELKIAVCDRLDGYGDSALMIKARPCNNCDQPFKVDYDTTSIVSTTTYETTSTVTQPASGIARGTISYITYVTAFTTSTESSSLPEDTSEAFSATSSESIPQTSSEVIFPTTSTILASFTTSTLATFTSATTSDTTLPDTVTRVATSEDTTSVATTSVSSEMAPPPSTSSISAHTTFPTSSSLESDTTLQRTLESTSSSVSTFTTLSLHTTFLTSEPASSTTESVTSSNVLSVSTSEASLESTSTETPPSSSTLLPGPRCRPRRSR